MTRLVPTTRRPLPLVRRPDLRLRRLRFRGEDCWVVKDPVAGSYYRLDAEHHFVLTRLDGRATLDGLAGQLAEAFPRSGLKAAGVAELLKDFHRRRLVLSDRPGQGEALRTEPARKGWLRETLRNPLFIKVPVADPTRLLTALTPAARLVTRPAARVALSLAVAVGWLLLVVRGDRLAAELAATDVLFAWPNLVVAWLVLGAVKVAHELGHGLACRLNGGECREIGVAFLLFSPCLYCDVSDAWMLAERRRRMAIAAAGMATELAISAAAAAVWACTRPGLIHTAALDVILVTWGATVLFNLNPLLRYDGYHLLADAVEIPNLRSRAAAALRRAAARVCLGLPPEPRRRERDREPRWLAWFGAASAAYRWLLLGGIAAAVATVAEPVGLKPVVWLAAASIVVVAVSRGVAAIAREASRSKRERGGVRMTRPIVAAAGLVAAAAAVLFVPLPCRDVADCVLEPDGLRTAYVLVPGRLDELLAAPGDRVTAGEPLARLSDPALDEERLGLLVRLGQLKADLDWKEAARETAAAEEIRRAAGTLRARLDQLDKRRDRLTVVAPCDGTVVDVEPGGSDGRPSGPPALRAAHVGTYLPARTPVFQVAPADGWRAILSVPPEVRRRLRVGGRVAVRLDALPAQTFDGVITAIAPLAASDDRRTDPTGGKGEAAHEVTVRLAAAEHPVLRAGLRGRARIDRSPVTIAERLQEALASSIESPF